LYIGSSILFASLLLPAVQLQSAMVRDGVRLHAIFYGGGVEQTFTMQWAIPNLILKDFQKKKTTTT
jgi:hypothetical protein